jgi:hypothetical protein
MAVTMESCPSVGGPLPPKGSNGLDNDMETLFEISEMSPSEVEEIQNGNSYIKELTNGCYLSLLQPTNYNISGHDKLFGWYIISIQKLLHLYYSQHHYSLRTALAPFVPPEVAQDSGLSASGP